MLAKGNMTRLHIRRRGLELLNEDKRLGGSPAPQSSSPTMVLPARAAMFLDSVHRT